MFDAHGIMREASGFGGNLHRRHVLAGMRTESSERPGLRALRGFGALSRDRMRYRMNMSGIVE